MPLFRRASAPSRGVRLYFATDIHGSERCFRKFLNAATAYGVDHLILGGDIIGKTLVPIERTSRGWSANYNDHDYIDLSESDRAELERRIRDNGSYPVLGERDELLALRDASRRDEVFRQVAVESVERWVALAEERLADTGVRLFVAPGNDDFWEIDGALEGSDVVEMAEGRRVRLDDKHEMIVTGYSNVTPWHTFRELDEDAFAQRLEEMSRHVERFDRLIAVIHPPPYATCLDQAPALDHDFRIQRESGDVKFAPVGSSAVREFIERRQPLLGLHGHVHDSRGAERIGRTLVLNPGSEYTEGVLAGAIVAIEEDRVLSHQFVTG